MEEIIKVFNEVRDLPYHCPECLDEEDYRCWGKHRILLKKLLELGYKARLRVCDFIWNEQKLPEEIKSLAPEEKARHPFVEVYLNGKWVILDATMDSGVPMHNKWDGKSDCKIGVKCSKIYSPEESIELEKQEREEYEENFRKYEKFHKAFNKFFEGFRNN